MLQVAENLERVGASQYCKMCGIMSLMRGGDSSLHGELDKMCLWIGKCKSGDLRFGGAMYGT